MNADDEAAWQKRPGSSTTKTQRHEEVLASENLRHLRNLGLLNKP